MSLKLRVSELVMEMTDESLDVERDQGVASLMKVELQSLDLIESGRADTYFALIPELPLDHEYEYALWYDEVQLSAFYRFRPLHISREVERTELRECFAILEYPDPKMMVNETVDEAPQAGIQRSYGVRVFPSVDGVIDQEGSSNLAGVVTFEWISVGETERQHGGVTASLYGGVARSEPLTTPLGEQKLFVTAHTVR